MKKQKRVFRCYAKHTGGLWVACCIDLTLAAQAETLTEAKRKLHAQMVDYIREAYTIDRAHTAALMNRKAPLVSRLEYYVACLFGHLGKVKNGIYSHFEERILVPA